MNPAELREVLERRGALLEGHFRLSSGRHSDVFLQKFRVFEDPRLTQSLGAALAGLFGGQFEAVVSPAVGAIPLGFATALAADTRVLFAERVEGALALRRGFELHPRERVLVVEDVITTAGSAREVVELVAGTGARPVGVGVLIDRGDPARVRSLDVPLRSLLRLETQSWPPEECPLCEAGDQISDPGSRRL